jgi:hypothetical protein
MGKGLKKFLKKVVIDGGLQEQIAVQDATLGKAIKVCEQINLVNREFS